jgi:hypothetical protein
VILEQNFDLFHFAHEKAFSHVYVVPYSFEKCCGNLTKRIKVTGKESCMVIGAFMET